MVKNELCPRCNECYWPIKDNKPTKIGNSYYFLIPAQYIGNGALTLDKRYMIAVYET